MNIGLALPQMGGEVSPALITEIAQEAERLEYASLWVRERLLRPRHFVAYGHPSNPMPDYFKSVYDPLETLSYIAAKTERIKLGTSVINALFHVPVVLARRFATLDQFSQGRVIAGLGQGWVKDEFETANIPFQRRGNGFEDYIGALRAVWGPNPVQYEGRYYRIVESDIGSKPFHLQGPPPLVGGVHLRRLNVPRVLRIASILWHDHGVRWSRSHMNFLRWYDMWDVTHILYR